MVSAKAWRAWLLGKNTDFAGAAATGLQGSRPFPELAGCTKQPPKWALSAGAAGGTEALLRLWQGFSSLRSLIGLRLPLLRDWETPALPWSPGHPCGHNKLGRYSARILERK